MNHQELPQHNPENANESDYLDRIEQLQLELKLFKHAEQISDSGTWQINLSTYEAFYTDNYYRLYGLQPGEIHPHAHTFTSFIVAEDLPVVVNALERSLVEKIPLHLEYRILRKDGLLRHISVISNISKNNRGEMLMTGITHDITERKHLELELGTALENLRVQHELSSHAEQIGHIGLWQLNLHTRKAFFSAGFLKVWGIKHSSISGFDDLASMIHPDDVPLFEAIRTKTYNEANALDVEFRIIRSNDGKSRTIKLKSRLIKNDEGNILHAGLIQDVSIPHELQSRLYSMNEQLLLQNQSFAQAERSAGMGSWTFVLGEDKVSYSSNLFHLFGLKPEAVNKPLHFFNNIHPEDRERLKAMVEKMKTEDIDQDFTFRIIRADGKLRHLRSRSRTIVTADKGKIVIGSTQDITEEVLLQQQLKERINFAEMLSDTMTDMIIVTDRNHSIISCNEACAQRYKQEKQSILNSHFFDVAGEWKKTIVPGNLKIALSGEPAQSQHVRDDGGNYFEILHVPLKKESQVVVGVLNVFHDITHSYRLKQEVQQRLDFLEKMIESTVDRIVATDANLKFILWNSKCEAYYGIQQQDVLGKHLLEVFPDFLRNPVYQGFKKVLKGETVHLPAVVDASSKEYFETYLSPVLNEEGGVNGVLWVTHDLSRELAFQLEQKKEIDLRTELQSMLKEAEKMAHLGSWELLLPAGKMKWSDEVFRLYGYEPQAFEPSLQFYYSTTHKDDRKLLKQAIENCADKEMTAELSCKIHVVHGDLRYIETKIQSQLLEDGLSMRIIGTMLDFTEQKSLREELQKQAGSIRLQQQLLLQNEKIKKIGSWQMQGNTREMIWGDSLFRLFGISPHAMQPTIDEFIKIVHRDDQEHVRETIEAMIKNPEASLSEFEFRICKKGVVLTMRFNARHIFTEQGSGFFGTVTDVTAEAQLKQELQLINALLNQLLDGYRICILDQQKHIIACNASWEQYTGRNNKDVKGLDIMSVIPGMEQDDELVKVISIGLNGNQTDMIRQEEHWVITPVMIGKEVAGVMIRISYFSVGQDNYSSAFNSMQ